MFNHTYNQNYI